MTQTRTYPHGVPCWVDVVATDVHQAKRFYSGLFGWTFPIDAPDDYVIATLDGNDVAAIARAQPGEDADWRTYIAVDDADATAAAVTAAGVTVTQSPVDAGPAGREVGCVDPRGAPFRLWQPHNLTGAQVANTPGSWNFSDLVTSDPSTAAAFYSPLFGWQIDDLGFATLIRRPGYGDHLEATVDPDVRARQPEVAAPPGFEDAVAWIAAGDTEVWQVSFSVADRDDAVQKARVLGATVVGIEDTQWTRTATIRDPQGAQLVLSQFTPPSGRGTPDGSSPSPHTG